uniref:hypothetical protein n=1 Tax=Larkinella sp. C7 TaxID=2576607 RepID=UPI001BB0E7FE
GLDKGENNAVLCSPKSGIRRGARATKQLIYKGLGAKKEKAAKNYFFFFILIFQNLPLPLQSQIGERVERK